MITIHRHSLGDTHFTYRTCGSGPDILLIHGWLSSSRMWEALMHELSPYFRLWAIDLVGFGDSWIGDSTGILTFEDQTRLVVAFCKSLGIHPHAIIGHSMGGSIALNIALDHPKFTEKLIAVSPVITGHLVNNVDQWLVSPVGQTVLGWAQFVWPQVFTLPQIAQFVAPPYLSKEVVSRTMEDLKKATWGASLGWLQSMFNLELVDRLTEIKQPVLLLSGGQDATVPAEDSHLAAERLPCVRYVERQDCHHQLPDEDPECFYREISNFLEVNLWRSSYAA